MIKSKYISNMGGITIGDENFKAIYSNGKGDGEFKVIIYEKGEKLIVNELYFIESISGKNFYVYKYDCDRDYGIIAELSGKYGVYRDEKGNIYIEYWNDDVR